MGKLMDRLQKQLKTEHEQDARDCIEICDYLLETTGHVWGSQWDSLTTVTFKEFPSHERWYRPNNIGHLVLQALRQKSNEKDNLQNNPNTRG